MVQRARIVQACATGATNTAVATRFSVTRQMVGKWGARFVARRFQSRGALACHPHEEADPPRNASEHPRAGDGHQSLPRRQRSAEALRLDEDRGRDARVEARTQDPSRGGGRAPRRIAGTRSRRRPGRARRDDPS
ncbi:MAG: hypothetical protein E6J76_13620 [Deltaproteobacteria bacterium]|nr:MAG: hypothetical protein E6J76_13620 [Deltaproteobacteria bacterium]TMA75982.1 MAG: hypothetical protein E6J77_23215 [Deltaproteobacteria bacterium]